METPGARDLANAADALAARIPKPLKPLAKLAYNYRWAWLPDGDAVFRAVDANRWQIAHQNPVRLLMEAPVPSLARAAGDPKLLARADAVLDQVGLDLARPDAHGPVTPENPAVFFCAEFAIHQSLPIYSGGLGVLAGDFLKEASDLAVPMVGIGLMYDRGYFRQRIDGSGWQQEYWVDTDPWRVPAALVTDDFGLPLTVTVPIAGRKVTAQIWRVDVGRVPLYLLDTNRPENPRWSRWITAQLYVGDAFVRQAQYILLGIGGVRALRAMGIEPGLIHLNEGHAAFAPLELVREETADGVPVGDAIAHARAKAVFTTHTPVPAGNDTYRAAELQSTLRDYPSQVGLDDDEFFALGRSRPEDRGEPFGITQLALRVSRHANGVSKRHGEVAREMWNVIYPDTAVEDVPIGHVTNGVHLPTWLGKPMRSLLDRYLGPGWDRRAADPATWAAIDRVPDEELWAVRNEQRRALVEYVRDSSVVDRLGRGESLDYVEAAARAFDPDVLTIGFARRVASYKRLYLLLADRERALRLLAGDRPIQLVIAGKAHPRDDEAKRLLQQLFNVKREAEVAERCVVLNDYDMAMAAKLVQGCDVWVNLPRPPMEASGTSGMKAAANGGLNLSVLDGWWAEAYDGTNGWQISGEVDADTAAQDARHAHAFYDLMEREVVPEYADRDASGIPRAWLLRVKASLRTCAPQYSATRMVRDYVKEVYPAK